MEIRPDKTKVMTNNSHDFHIEMNIKGQMLKEVKSFKISNEGSKSEITFHDCPDNSCSLQTETCIERQEHLYCS